MQADGTTPLPKSIDPEANGKKCSAWLEKTYKGMAPYFEKNKDIPSNAAYRNYPNAGLKDWQHAYYGDNYERLQKVKKQYDPTGAFKYGQSVELQKAEL